MSSPQYSVEVHDSDSDNARAPVNTKLWTSTPCEHLDRAYTPPDVRLLETEDPLLGRRVELFEGETLTFVYCGCEAHCQCYDVFDQIRWPLLVACDGGLRYQKTPAVVSGIGIYFGKDSPLNISEILPADDKPRSTVRTEIYAALRALQTIVCLVEAGILPGVKEVVVKTDSRAVTDAMVKCLPDYRNNGWLRTDKKPLGDRDLLFQLDEVVAELYNQHGVAVRFHWVPRNYNGEADRLASLALAEEDVRRKKARTMIVAKAIEKALEKRPRENDFEDDTPELKRPRLNAMPSFIGPVQQDTSSLSAIAMNVNSRPDRCEHDSAAARQEELPAASSRSTSFHEDQAARPPGFIGPVRPCGNDSSELAHAETTSLDSARHDSAAAEHGDSLTALERDIETLLD